MVAIDEVQQGLGLAAQAVDDVAVVDDVAMLVTAGRPAARQGEDLGSAQQAEDPVIVDAQGQRMADEPRRDGVEYVAQPAYSLGSGKPSMLYKSALLSDHLTHPPEPSE